MGAKLWLGDAKTMRAGGMLGSPSEPALPLLKRPDRMKPVTRAGLSGLSVTSWTTPLVPTWVIDGRASRAEMRRAGT
jgi:hypothetical protein